VLEPGSNVLDIVHVSDLFATFARIGGAWDGIPRDQVIDGVDQTGVLLLGDSNGRGDYVHMYDGPAFIAMVKNKYKMDLSLSGANPIAAPIFDLYRDPREERPLDSIKYSPWAGGQFATMIKRHMAYKMKYPDLPPTLGVPYGGIEDLRPETQRVLETFMAGLPKKP
jgi:hypothetical protein